MSSALKEWPVESNGSILHKMNSREKIEKPRAGNITNQLARGSVDRQEALQGLHTSSLCFSQAVVTALGIQILSPW